MKVLKTKNLKRAVIINNSTSIAEIVMNVKVDNTGREVITFMIKYLTRTLNFIAEFKDESEERPGATEFLQNYSEDVQLGIDRWEMLASDEQRRVLDKATEVLGLIVREWEKAEVVQGNDLRLAMVLGLRHDLRKSAKSLREDPIIRPSLANAEALSGH